jgi:hypothetical protein
MSKHNIIKFDPTVPAKFSHWFGAPAVFSDEELQIYNKMLCGHLEQCRFRRMIGYQCR